MTEPTPKSFVSGDTVTWTYASSEYDSQDGYVVEYKFVAPGVQQTVIGVAQSDGAWLFTLDATASAGWRPDTYGWQRYVSLAGDRYTTGGGWTTVHQNYAASIAGADPRIHWQRVIEAIDATIEGRASSDMNQYSINGRSITKMTMSELLEARGYALTRLNQHLQATGQGGTSRIIRTVI